MVNCVSFLQPSVIFAKTLWRMFCFMFFIVTSNLFISVLSWFMSILRNRLMSSFYAYKSTEYVRICGYPAISCAHCLWPDHYPISGNRQSAAALPCPIIFSISIFLMSVIQGLIKYSLFCLLSCAKPKNKQTIKNIKKQKYSKQ